MSGLVGKFITLEGGEGVGKSLFQSKLAQRLEKKGLRLVQTREPGGTPAADQIRSIFNHPPAEDSLTIETEAFLIAASRAQHCGKLIRPALEAGKWVLCDRFADSTRIYQGQLGKLPEEFLEDLIASSTKGLQPDITFLLDCPVEVSLGRLSQRDDAKTRYDDAAIEVHENLRQSYLGLAKKFSERFVVLDATQTVDQVVEEAWKKLEKHFG